MNSSRGRHIVLLVSIKTKIKQNVQKYDGDSVEEVKDLKCDKRCIGSKK